MSLFIIGILFISGCAYKENLVKYDDFDEALWPFLSSFEEAAAERGYAIQLNDLDLRGDVRQINEDGVAGWCRFDPNNPNIIAIDKDFWNEASPIWREFVVFHELGHCVLGRGHRETSDAQGNCISIMQSGLGNCRVAYSEGNRVIYLDELFTPSNF